VPAICTIPAGQSSEFEGIIDLIRMKLVLKDPTDPKNVRYSFVDIPEKYRAQAAEYHQHLLEAASHGDDHMLELVVEGKPVSEELLRSALRKATLTNQVTPVHCGSAKTYQGIQLLLDAVVDYLPSPADRAAVQGIVPKSKEKAKAERKPDPKEPFAALAFKTVSESTGDLVYTRIYSGELRPKDDVLNASSGPARSLLWSA